VEGRPIALIFLLLAQCPQNSVKPYNVLHLLELMNNNIWPQLHKTKRYKLRETGIFGGKSEVYIDLNREKPVLI